MLLIKNPLADKSAKHTILQENCRQHTQVKVNFYLEARKLTSRTLANQTKTLVNETLAKQLIGKTSRYRLDKSWILAFFTPCTMYMTVHYFVRNLIVFLRVLTVIQCSAHGGIRPFTTCIWWLYFCRVHA